MKLRDIPLLLALFLPAFPMLHANPLPVPALPAFASDDWSAIEDAFANAPTLTFQQAWQPEPSPSLRPATVRLGWRGDRFLYFATLTDDEPTTRATGPNQRLWELGDVLECFAGVHKNPAYIEYHTAPTGHTLRLLWPTPDAFRSLKSPSDLANFLATESQSVLRARLTASGWQVYGEIPATALPGSTAPLRGQTWDISFGRYDAARDPAVKPTLASTSALQKPSYHRRPEWSKIRFE